MKFNKKALAGVGLGAVALVGGTFAYYNQTLTIDNPMKTGHYENELVEEFTPPTDEVKPGSTIVKKVGAINTGDYPVMVRIRMDEKWQRTGEEPFGVHGSADNDFDIDATSIETNKIFIAAQIDDTDGKTEAVIAGENCKDGSVVYKKYAADSNWIKGTDGYWYYNAVLEPKGEGKVNETGDLLESLTIASNIDLGHYIEEDYYYVGKKNLNKAEITDWIAYEVVKDTAGNTTDIKLGEVSVGDLNEDGMINAIDMAKKLENDDILDSDKALYRKNVSLLDENAKGYADANYTLTITSQFVQATPDAIAEAFGDITKLPKAIQDVIGSIDLDN